MDFWQRARSLAEEAAKRSQELTNGITVPSKLSDVVSEASKRSMEIATEASRKSKEIATEALKRADQIKSQLPPAAVAFSTLVDANSPSATAEVSEADLEKFGVTNHLREFVKGITTNTFRDFPLEDDSEISDVPAVSNVRQDLTEWQEKHAKLVLSTVKEIKKLRYELCPRVMKERKFWRIYFILVSSFVDQYEKVYMEEQKLKATEQKKENVGKETPPVGTSSGAVGAVTNPKSKTASSDQDLDVFLLGDAGDSDDGPDDGDAGDAGDDDFDDDFDKI